MPTTIWHLKRAVWPLVCGLLCTAGAQDLHMRVTGQSYSDNKISVTAPAHWTIAGMMEKTAAVAPFCAMEIGSVCFKM